MPDAGMLGSWTNFYVITGAAGATLTGLQFVVIALVGQSRVKTTMHEIAAFGTPTILHFGAALLVSALLTAPWPGIAGPVVLLACTGVVGVIYTTIVVRRVQRQRGYVPEAEDWIWHVVLPLATYAALAMTGALLPIHPAAALFGSAGATLLLLVVGIHNAWDTVIYITVRAAPDSPT